jgi:hypothetical protein
MEPIKASLIRVPDQGGVSGRARTGGRGVILDSRNPKSADNSPLENPRTRACAREASRSCGSGRPDQQAQRVYRE